MNSLRLALLAFALAATARGDDGYRLWLRFDPIPDAGLRRSVAAAIPEIVLPEQPRPILTTAGAELAAGLRGLLGTDVPIVAQATRNQALLFARPTDPATAAFVTETDLRAAGEEGYIVRRVAHDGTQRIVIVANRDRGFLYGAYALLRHLQTGHSLENLNLVSAPKIERRILDHWDQLDRFIERGYAGFSLWEWFYLPDYRTPRYRDYARACASLGINGTVLNNVNADALILTPAYLTKVAALADEFRPYGIRVYLSARFSAPMAIGGLKTADPLDPSVAAWWHNKADEIYRLIPDFGGFLVKANSEGQPGPQDYHRTHADGANLLADALSPHDGIVMWRAFVYKADAKEDRIKQAYSEFTPLDGQFRQNVVVQIKNGPLDFMPREPFSPLFGAMPKTRLALEVQLSQEYLGQSTQVAFLAPMWKEVLDSDTYAAGAGSTVAHVIDGSLKLQSPSVMAGVANTGTDRDWTGHPLAQANWYAFGRLAWDPALNPEQIADEWTRQTFGGDPTVVSTISKILLGSRETVVNYSMPLGLHHIMAEGHHYGPGPWVDGLARSDWNATYYHRADAVGLGRDRTATGSNALEQYAPELAQLWGDPATCPDKFLLWFHHLPWDYKMKSGRTLWDELCLRYQRGVDEVRTMQHEWESLAGRIDPELHAHVQALMRRQEHDACDWRDACLLYFGQFSHRPLPAGVEPPAHDLAYYENLKLHFAPGHPGDH